MGKTFVSTAAAILCATAALAGVEGTPLGLLMGKELRQAVAGNTVYLSTSGIVLPIAYHPNGTMSGKLPAFAAALAGETPTADRGSWWIAENRLCQRWKSWLDGKSHCYRFTSDGSTVTWVRDDGRRGTARISG